VGKASFSGFSTPAGCGPGRPGCAVPAQWHRTCRPAGTRPTRREPGANPCHWRAKSGHRLPNPNSPLNARRSAFWRLFRRPSSYRILGLACIRNAGGPARLGPGRAEFPLVLQGQRQGTIMAPRARFFPDSRQAQREVRGRGCANRLPLA
jgi:hypothetical protein